MRGKRRQPQSVTDFRRSMVQVQIGNRTYDAQYLPNCKTCTHPARMLIEEKILQNFSFRAIAKLFSETEIPDSDNRTILLPKISHVAIHNHFRNGHMPLEAATLRHLAEKRAADIGSRYEEAGEQFVDHVMLSEAVVRRTYDRLVTNEIEPDVKDGLAAVKILQEVESSTRDGLDAEAWAEAMEVYFETARYHMDEVTWNAFTADLQANPVLAAIQRRIDRGQVVDAEPATPQIEGKKSA